MRAGIIIEILGFLKTKKIPIIKAILMIKEIQKPLFKANLVITL